MPPMSLKQGTLPFNPKSNIQPLSHCTPPHFYHKLEEDLSKVYLDDAQTALAAIVCYSTSLMGAAVQFSNI